MAGRVGIKEGLSIEGGWSLLCLDMRKKGDIVDNDIEIDNL
jgi:hypothetical protein